MHARLKVFAEKKTKNDSLVNDFVFSSYAVIIVAT